MKELGLSETTDLFGKYLPQFVVMRKVMSTTPVHYFGNINPKTALVLFVFQVLFEFKSNLITQCPKFAKRLILGSLYGTCRNVFDNVCGLDNIEK